jgi:hypothetical protein
VSLEDWFDETETKEEVLEAGGPDLLSSFLFFSSFASSSLSSRFPPPVLKPRGWKELDPCSALPNDDAAAGADVTLVTVDDAGGDFFPDFLDGFFFDAPPAGSSSDFFFGPLRFGVLLCLGVLLFGFIGSLQFGLIKCF